MADSTFNLTPDPKVLIALTHTPMQPLDALCELIDNGIDSFQTGRLTGTVIENPLIIVELPTLSQVNSGQGIIRVRDNGPGLTSEMAEQAVRVGFSGNNPYDSLGLFGMGFNISTGKLGRRARLFTARERDEVGLEVIIDLEQIQQSRSYEVPAITAGKPPGFISGTVVEVSGWWPEGNANSGFVRKLVQYGLKKIQEELGRRYATVLRHQNVRIVVNSGKCEPFEHCRWGENRFVERREHGKIPAVFNFNQVLGAQTRCGACTAVIPGGSDQCMACGSSNFRTVEERVRGWVGIQRYDHRTDFGIDLIRNGRAIKIGEKNAFFEYVDEFKHSVMDYPIDSGAYGRIIGEIHIDHVPVDFLKQDFQRSSPEWQRAMSFLRGDSSLQPGQPNADKNQSPIYQLYQGYRRVQTPGKKDMYMGYWDATKSKPVRVSRDVEKEYYEKFLKRLPGYYDDTEWWKLVDQADTPPAPELVECPACSAQNLKEHDICAVCGFILISKACINPECGKLIPQSADLCMECGASQTPTVEKPWICDLCGTRNSAGRENCSDCGEPRGSVNPLSREYLALHANKDDDLSIRGCSVPLADGSHSMPIDVDVYVTTGPIIARNQPQRIPMMTFKGDRIEIFVDKAHQAFSMFDLRPEQMIASEVSVYIYDSNRKLSGQQYQGMHTLSNIEWEIINGRWAQSLDDGPDKVRSDIQSFFNGLRLSLPMLVGRGEGGAGEFYDYMTVEQQTGMVGRMVDQQVNISTLGEMKTSGNYLRYVGEDVIVDIFRKSPDLFFDGQFWAIPFKEIGGFPEASASYVRNRIFDGHLNCLEDAVHYLRYERPDLAVTRRARMSLDYLQAKVV